MGGWIWVELKLCADGGASPMDQLFGAEHKLEIKGLGVPDA
jgi:hypothetical protein